ncbi:hypothetical protein Bca4012_058411 [Brassica carinata]|uniref:Ubiquitin-like protease family profile domain-containing protein n=1 Tax=Brassica carinata TaxID=52824 RepID=A0A8X8B642_BRACI|nr:hypothetical protein Bca52824_016171 [Brassica carinata]
MIPRIVKAVQPAKHQKNFLVAAYTVDYFSMDSLNQSACDCGVYAVKFIECYALGLELSLVNDDNIKKLDTDCCGIFGKQLMTRNWLTGCQSMNRQCVSLRLYKRFCENA